jgi:NTE family protein
MTDKKSILLALQGGGAHGAFTWGVLDTLLADGRLQFPGISGTSAGALNAVALAHGWAQAEADQTDPAEGARASLANLWDKVMTMGSASEPAARLAKLMVGALPGAMTHVSPYQTNPLNVNPLLSLIKREIDFDRLARLKAPRVFVAATEVETGRAEIFSGKRLTADAVMASACLPQLFQAPEIDGKLYWDGGYSANPALGPLIAMGECSDILVVQINPLKQHGKPTSADQIHDRVNDLNFNASLIAQMRTIALLNTSVETGLARAGVQPVRVHRIDGGTALAGMPAESKVTPNRATVDQLFALGQESARRWLKRHLSAVGERGTVNLRRDYGDPFKPEFHAADAASAGGFDLAPYLWSSPEERARVLDAGSAAKPADATDETQAAEKASATERVETP